MQKVLSSLIPAASAEEFLQAFENNDPFVVHHGSSAPDALTSLPFLASLPALLNAWPRSIQAHLPDVRDESSSIDTNPADAEKLFNNGMGLLFNQAQTISPVLNQWLENLRKDLGLSAMTYSRCLIYATPNGQGTAPHFDQNINFVLQIHGQKTWHLAANESVLYPLTRHTMGAPVEPEMASYVDGEMPTAMPPTAQTIVLKPGSFLFVPRGVWHSTEAQEDALALNFTFTAPTWLDLFTAALRSRLAMSPAWRETAHGVSSPDGRELAEVHLDTLLETLMEDLPHWDAAGILSATEE
jgi:50S ribosomal protein L16 3-hydroxylase